MCEAMELLEDNTGKNHFAISLFNNFLSMMFKAQAIKAKVDKWDIKLKICIVKEKMNRMKRQPVEWETYFPARYLIRYKELIQHNSKQNPKNSEQ